jgi:hypothetical protein
MIVFLRQRLAAQVLERNQQFSSSHNTQQNPMLLSKNMYQEEHLGSQEQIGFYQRMGLIKSNNSWSYLHGYTRSSFEMGSQSLDITPLAFSATFQSSRVGQQIPTLFTQVNLWNEMYMIQKFDSRTLYKLVKGTY